MLNDSEKTELRRAGCNETHIDEIEEYEANVSMFMQCLRQMQISGDPVQAQHGEDFLARFQAFSETPYAQPDEAIRALDALLLETLRYLKTVETQGQAIFRASQALPSPGASVVQSSVIAHPSEKKGPFVVRPKSPRGSTGCE